MENNTLLLSLRASSNILTLFSVVEKYQPLSSRAEILEQALDYTLENPLDWKNFDSSRNSSAQNDGHAPMFIQIKVDPEKWSSVTEQIKNSFNPPLKRTTIPYILRLVLEYYIRHIEALNEIEPVEIEETAPKAPKNEDLSDFETVRRIVQMISLNRETDKPILEAIKSILKSWSE